MYHELLSVRARMESLRQEAEQQRLAGLARRGAKERKERQGRKEYEEGAERSASAPARRPRRRVLRWGTDA